jgi:hypothetical protein
MDTLGRDRLTGPEITFKHNKARFRQRPTEPGRRSRADLCG